MKKSLGLYISIVIFVLGMALLIIFGLASLSEAKLSALNDKYMPLYVSGEKGVSAPWYKDGLHVVDEGFINEIERLDSSKPKIMALGSSMSIISCKSEPVELEGGYDYGFLVCGNGSYRSDYQLYDLYRKSGIQNPKDIIKLEVSFSTFRYVDLTIADATLGKWGKYKVDGLEVKKNAAAGAPLYYINKQLLKIQNIWELSYDYFEKKSKSSGCLSGHEHIIPGNFINNYFAYDAVANSCNINPEIEDGVLDIVDMIQEENNLVVELSPLPEGLKNTEFGQDMNRFIDEKLIPHLENIDVKYLDYRNDYLEDEFCDGVHLGYEATDKYRNRLRTDLNEIINR